MAEQDVSSAPGANSYDFEAAEQEPELSNTNNSTLFQTTLQSYCSSDNYGMSASGVFACNAFSYQINNKSIVDPTHSNQVDPTASQRYAPVAGNHAVIAQEAAIIEGLDKSLQWDPEYRPPNQARDFFAPEVVQPVLRWDIIALEELVNRTPEITPPRPLFRNNRVVGEDFPEDPWEGLPAASFNAGFGTCDPETLLGLNHQPQPSDFSSVSQDPIFNTSQGSHVSLGSRTSSPQYGFNYSSLQNNSVTTSNRCIECNLAHTKCELIPGLSSCDRCTTLLWNQLRGSQDHTSFIGSVTLIDIESTQMLLIDLRDEAEELSGLQPGVSLEDLFDGSMLCHMDHSIRTDSAYSLSGVPVVIRHLTTTRKAKASADNLKLSCPLPALDANQMDSFIDIGNRMCNLETLQPIEKNIIVTALRCSDYLGILFNWDCNSICFEVEWHGASVSQGKNLVLETVYAISFRVQELLKILSFETIQSLKEPNNPDHDPGTISCALWIVYSSLNAFRKLKWDAKGLQNLVTSHSLRSEFQTLILEQKKFLNRLHARAPAAVKALERYRREVAFKRCGEMSRHIKAFKELVDAKKIPKSVISFRYERRSNMITLPTYSRQQSYTDILESGEYDLTFLGTYRLPEPSPEENPKSPAYSTISLEELQKHDRSLAHRSRGRSVGPGGPYQGSVASNPSKTDDNVPALTTNKTTVEDSETGVGAGISSLESRSSFSSGLRMKGFASQLAANAKTPKDDDLLIELTKLQSNLTEQSTNAKRSRGKKTMLPDTDSSSLSNQQLRCQKHKQAQSLVKSNAASIASSSSSHRSPQPKRQQKTRSSPNPQFRPDVNNVAYLGEEDFSAYLWDHQFNFDYMRDDNMSVEENNFHLG